MRGASDCCIVAIAVALVATPMCAVAQQPAKMPRIGWLGDGAPSGGGDFQRGLRDAGYIEGKNVLIEYRYAGGDVGRLPDFAAQFVQMPVDVIVTSGESAALAAKRATKAVPIVATEFGLDPVKAGLVASLARPDGNLTGLTSFSEDLWPKRLDYLKELAPRTARLGVLWNPSNPGNAVCVDELRAAAPKFGLQLHPVEIRDAKMLEAAFAALAKSPTDALATCWDSVTLKHAKEIADFALKNRWPLLAPLKEYAQAGALLSYGASLADQRRRAAYYVNKIIKGAKPAELPVERPTTFELVLNLRTAKALGLAMSPALSLMADDIIE